MLINSGYEKILANITSNPIFQILHIMLLNIALGCTKLYTDIFFFTNFESENDKTLNYENPLNKDIPKTHIPRSHGNHIQSKD